MTVEFRACPGCGWVTCEQQVLRGVGWLVCPQCRGWRIADFWPFTYSPKR